VALGWLNPYIVGHYRLEVVNDVFNGMGTSSLVILPRRTRTAVWRCTVGSLGTVVVPSKWSAVLTLHYRHTVVVCPHVLHALIAVSARTSCKPMMALTSGALETDACIGNRQALLHRHAYWAILVTLGFSYWKARMECLNTFRAWL
jgi:hypothetical protein